MAEPKIYVPKSSAKEVQFQDGGSIIKLSFNAAVLAQFARDHANEKGYLNLTLAKRREPGQYGDTHSICLDTWKPTGRQQSAPKPINPAPSGKIENEDVPF